MTFKLFKFEFILCDKILNGLFCVHYEKTPDGHFDFWTFHLICRKNWYWGYSESWYDGPWKQFGLGPLFLIAWR